MSDVDAGEQAPEKDTARQNLPPLFLVRQAAERQADDGVEEREDRAEQPERRVAEAPLAADAFADAADDLAVEEVHQVDGEQHDERVHSAWGQGTPRN